MKWNQIMEKSEFSKIMEDINKLDEDYRKLYKEKCYTSNPFSFTCGQTYAWVEEDNSSKKTKERKKQGKKNNK